MDWWNSIDKAGNLSKLAITALKNAQQKIDSVLDINEIEERASASVPLSSDGGAAAAAAEADDVSSDYGNFVNDLSDFKSTPPGIDGEGKELDENIIITTCADLNTESASNQWMTSQLEAAQDSSSPSPQLNKDESPPDSDFINETPPDLTVDMSTPVTLRLAESPPHPLMGSSIDTIFVPSSDSEARFLPKSCSEGDLSQVVLVPSSEDKSPHDCHDEDRETNATGSDIEVVSCCTSTNGESHTPTTPGKTGSSIVLSDSRQLPAMMSKLSSRILGTMGPTAFIPLRGHSAPMGSGTLCRHRRAVSQDYSFTQSGPNEEDMSCALQRLSKQYADKKYLLGMREARIMQLCKENSELRDTNVSLEAQLTKNQGSSDVSELSSEFSQRLAKTELQLRTVSRERDQLKASLAMGQASKPRPDKASSSNEQEMFLKRIAELERSLNKKATQVDDLFKEGEAMAQKQLKTNNLVKKLRNSEQELNQQVTNQTEKIAQLSEQVQRAQDTIRSHEDTISGQLVTLNQLHKLSQVQLKELDSLKVQLVYSESTGKARLQELESLKTELRITLDQLQETKSLAESHADATLSKQTLRGTCQALRDDLASTKAELALLQASHNQQAEQWREERQYHQNLIADSTQQLESLRESASLDAQPILAQLQTVQASLVEQTAVTEQMEIDLNRRVVEAQHQAQTALANEKTMQTNLHAADARNQALDQQVCSLLAERDTLTHEVKRLCTINKQSDQVDQRQREQVAQLHSQCEQHLSRLSQLEETVRLEQDKVKSQWNENQQLRTQIRQIRETLRQQKQQEMTDEAFVTQPEQSSVQKTPARSSVSSLNGPSKSSRASSCADPISPSTTRSIVAISTTDKSQTAMEYMQSMLRLKEGECTQLRREIDQLAQMKESLLTEVATLSADADRLARLSGLPREKRSLNHDEDGPIQLDEMSELQQHYSRLLLLYGKVREENEELKMDLADVKEMYRTQIDLLMRADP